LTAAASSSLRYGIRDAAETAVAILQQRDAIVLSLTRPLLPLAQRLD
jgi:hypothetical protein